MNQKSFFISWVAHSTRSDSLAHHLGAQSVHIHYFKPKQFKYLYAPLKYLLSGSKTLAVLSREKPDFVFVQNPPIFCALTVWLWCLFSRAKLIIDSHTGAFDQPRWKAFHWLFRFLARRAALTIVHNDPLTQIVTNWGAAAITIGDIPFHLETDFTYPFRDGFNVVYVCTFSPDEPVDAVIAAAKALPEINFYVTGNLKYAAADIHERVPTNMTLTGFIPHKEYVALIKGCDVIMSLTTRNNTMQNGAYEAMEVGVPIITSNWPVLRQTFTIGTIHVDNTAKELIDAIEKMQKEHLRYVEEVRLLREERLKVWQENFSSMLQILGVNQ
jgi:glycosyltransferase involved in cell wall biosynthesis